MTRRRAGAVPPVPVPPERTAAVRGGTSVRFSQEERELLQDLTRRLTPNLAKAPGITELVRECALSLATWVTAAPRGPRVRYPRERRLRLALRELINLRASLGAASDGA